MARAHRHSISGYAWHLTHRCHKREFLLKFTKDKQRWMYWLFDAKKRFGICVLNFTVTSNHIHLLIYDTGNGYETIPKSIQLNIREVGRLRETYRNWVDSALMRGDIKRQPQWTESKTVGDKVYVAKVKDQMGYKAIGRKVVENGDSFVLREPQVSYQSVSDRAVLLQREDNTICWPNGSENCLDSNLSLEGSF